MLKQNNYLEVYLFNVGRGQATLIKTPHNHVVLYDLGSSNDLSPVNDIYRQKDFFIQMNSLDGNRPIAQCIVSHPHLDHISDLNDANTTFVNDKSYFITCQNDKEQKNPNHKIDFSRINNPGDCPQIKNYKSLYENRCLPLATINPNVDGVDFQIGYYYLTSQQVSELFPKDDQKYSNSLSIVLYLAYNGQVVLIPGDITPEAFKLILDGNCEKRYTDYKRRMNEDSRNRWATQTDTQPNLRTLLLQKHFKILVAPHHGLESGYPDCLFELLGDKKPEVILISEKPQSENSGHIDKRYQDGTCSIGTTLNGKKRYSITTRSDGHIKITIPSLLGQGLISNQDINELFK